MVDSKKLMLACLYECVCEEERDREWMGVHKSARRGDLWLLLSWTQSFVLKHCYAHELRSLSPNIAMLMNSDLYLQTLLYAWTQISISKHCYALELRSLSPNMAMLLNSDLYLQTLLCSWTRSSISKHCYSLDICKHCYSLELRALCQNKTTILRQANLFCLQAPAASAPRFPSQNLASAIRQSPPAPFLPLNLREWDICNVPDSQSESVYSCVRVYLSSDTCMRTSKASACVSIYGCICGLQELPSTRTYLHL